MNALSCYDSFSFEEKVTATYIQIIVTVNDKKSTTSRIIFNKTIPLPLAILLSIIIIPFLILLFVLALISGAFSFAKNEDAEPSYLEAKEYFNNGRGYLNNLSDKDKKELISKRENIPLGL